MAEESGNKKPAVETEQSHLKLSETLVGSQGDACGVSRCVGKRELHGKKKRKQGINMDRHRAASRRPRGLGRSAVH